MPWNVLTVVFDLSVHLRYQNLTATKFTDGPELERFIPGKSFPTPHFQLRKKVHFITDCVAPRQVLCARLGRSTAGLIGRRKRGARGQMQRTHKLSERGSKVTRRWLAGGNNKWGTRLGPEAVDVVMS